MLDTLHESCYDIATASVLASVGFVVCDWKEKARDEKSGKMAHESAVRNAEMWEAIYQNILQQMKNQGF